MAGFGFNRDKTSEIFVLEGQAELDEQTNRCEFGQWLGKQTSFLWYVPV